MPLRLACERFEPRDAPAVDLAFSDGRGDADPVLRRAGYVEPFYNHGTDWSEPFEVARYVSSSANLASGALLIEKVLYSALGPAVADGQFREALYPVVYGHQAKVTYSAPQSVRDQAERMRTAGAFEVRVIDPDNRIAESDESNNRLGAHVFSGGFIADMDLTGASFAVDNPNPRAGDEVRVTFAVRNAGPGAAAPKPVHLYLSTDAKITAEDTPLDYTGTPAVAAGAVTDPARRPVIIPRGTPDGRYWVGMRILNGGGAGADDLNAGNNDNVGEGIDLVPIQVGGAAGPVNLRARSGSFRVTPGQVAAGGSVTIDFGVENTGAVPAAAVRVGFYLSGDGRVEATDLPLGTADLGGLGAGQATAALSRTFAVPATLPAGAYTVGLVIDPENAVAEGDEADNGNRGAGTDSAAVTVTAGSGGPVTPPPVRPLAGPPGRFFAVGPDATAGPRVLVYAAGTGELVQSATAFDPGFTGGVRVATADVNADGFADLIAGTGPGTATRVRVLDGRTQAELFAVDPFEAAFTGGVYVAAGDLTGDGKADVVITPDEGGGPRVRVFGGSDFAPVADFFGIDDANFRGGARAAVGDLTGDRKADLVVAAGFLGGPRVAGFDGTTLASGAPSRVFGDFFAFEEGLRNGVFVAVGDLDGDGFGELVAGGGPGGGPRVLAFSGKALLANQYETRANFFAGDPENRQGVRVAVKDVDGDARADLVATGGAPGGRVTAYRGRELPPDGPPPVAHDFSAGDLPGAFVG